MDTSSSTRRDDSAEAAGNASPSTVKQHPAISERDGEVKAQRTKPKKPDFELDMQEVNKLFGILHESNFKGFSNIFGYSWRIPVLPQSTARYSPYSVHQMLYMRQQREQERRRLSLTMQPLDRNPALQRSFSLSSSSAGHLYSLMYRKQLVHKVIGFINDHSERLLSTLEDCSEKCVICMCYYQAEQSLRKLPCSHKFHRECIDEWLVKTLICPVCREKVATVQESIQVVDLLNEDIDETLVAEDADRNVNERNDSDSNVVLNLASGSGGSNLQKDQNVAVTKDSNSESSQINKDS